MSVEIQAAHAAHGHGDMAHGEISLSGYLTGFILSVILTAVPFYLVMTGVRTALVITAFAAVQIVVHMIFFLHMNTSSEGGWTMMALIFTIVMVVIAMTGSLWVMHHLNINMMPTHEMGRMQ